MHMLKNQAETEAELIIDLLTFGCKTVAIFWEMGIEWFWVGYDCVEGAGVTR